MVLAIDTSTGSNTTADAASLTWSHTASAVLASGIALVAASTPNAGGTLTATYNGVSMTAVTSGEATRASRQVKWFYLLSPPGGTQSVVISASVSQSIVGACITFVGALQAAPTNVRNLTSAATSSDEIAYTTPVGSYAVSAVTLAATGTVVANPGTCTEFSDLNSAGGTTNVRGHAVYAPRNGATTSAGWARVSGTSTEAMAGCVILPVFPAPLPPRRNRATFVTTRRF